jgi:hypothetical protein
MDEDTPRPSESFEVALDALATAASLAPIVGPLLQGLVQARTNDHTRRSITYLEQMVRDLDGRFSVIEDAIQDPKRADLLVSGLEIAVRTDEDTERFQLLVRVVAGGIQHPARTERAQLFVDILGQLQPVHLDYLRVIGMPGLERPMRNWRDNPWLGAWDTERGKERRQLEEVFTEHPNDIDPVVARLDSLGLIRPRTYQESEKGMRGGFVPLVPKAPEIRTPYVLTPFGADLLNFLNTSADTSRPT